MFGFAGQIFQFVARCGKVDNYGFNFSLRHSLSLWKAQKYFRAKVYTGPKYSPGQSIFWAKVVSGQSISRPKWVSDQSGLWAKLGVSHL